MWTGKELEESLVKEAEAQLACCTDTEMIELVSGRDSNGSGYCRLPCEVVSSLCLQTDALIALGETSLGSLVKGSLNYMLSAMVLLFHQKEVTSNF